MKDHAASVISDDQFANRVERYPSDTPDTKEAYWIRELFEHHFPSEAAAKTAVRCVWDAIGSFATLLIECTSGGYRSRSGVYRPIPQEELLAYTPPLTCRMGR